MLHDNMKPKTSLMHRMNLKQYKGEIAELPVRRQQWLRTNQGWWPDIVWIWTLEETLIGSGIVVEEIYPTPNRPQDNDC